MLCRSFFDVPSDQAQVYLTRNELPVSRIYHSELGDVPVLAMIIIKLKEAMQAYRRRAGRKLTYATLHEATGISIQALSSMANREDYNPTVGNIDKVCRELGVTPPELLEYVATEPATLKQTALKRQAQRKTKAKRA